jgi:hypothetical protein
LISWSVIKIRSMTISPRSLQWQSFGVYYFLQSAAISEFRRDPRTRWWGCFERSIQEFKISTSWNLKKAHDRQTECTARGQWEKKQLVASNSVMMSDGEWGPLRRERRVQEGSPYFAWVQLLACFLARCDHLIITVSIPTFLFIPNLRVAPDHVHGHHGSGWWMPMIQLQLLNETAVLVPELLRNLLLDCGRRKWGKTSMAAS